MGNKIIITESEKENIKKLYASINEDEKVNPNDVITQLTSDTELPKEKKEKSFIELLFLNDKNKSLFDKNYGSKSDSPTEKKSDTSSNDNYLDKTSSGSVDSKWMKVTKKVIDKFEGGYWNGANASNLKTSKLGICSNHPHGSMESSTETMFGLDRYNGSIEKTADGREFFRIIDNQKKELGMDKFCRRWKWLYRGGDLEDRLKTLAAKIMKHSFDRNMRNFVKSPELKKRIENNDRLLMHFSYASWNGPGFFQKFARSLEKAFKDGKSDKELIKHAIADRKNTGLVRQDKVAAVLTDPNLDLT